ncbi:PEGA domain-containing protein [uncultured Methylophaga sp.]|uniref:PEGA domain-containing protein n=1 Tax=uncultured Methylophaga sp. TaxID=285271 RepID=UPI0030DBE54A|tara:strand:- start:20714 stop:22720 length:2007 start_codon:yes stop_codon:yes gene_type:complete
MSQFNQQLEFARKRQHRMYLWLLTTFVLVFLIIVTVIFASRGTRIEVQPDDASDVSINAESWLAMVILDSVYSLAETTRIQVTAEGFYPHRKTIERADTGKVITVTLTPLPAKIILSTSLDDNLTQWLIDEQIIAVANSLEHELPAGDHQLIVQHPHYQKTSIDLSLSRGETVTQIVELPPLQGEFVVNSVPTGAMVTVDAVEVGKTPLTIPLQGGFHDVQLTLEKYETTEETIEIKNSSPTIERNYRLSAETAAVLLNLQPSGGQLTLNGLRIVNQDRISVEAGKQNRLNYSKPGFFSKTETFTLDTNEKRAIGLTLEEEIGKVEVLSKPSAEVKIDGKTVGNTPIELELNAIPHDVQLSLQGYRTVAKSITPTANEPQKLSVTLIPEAQAKKAEAPRVYKTKAGGEMALFFPNDIIKMGAGRDEPGQRANEFLKQVRLNRPFYAGTHEVTNAEFQQFDSSKSGDAQLPITNVSWLEAVKFCNWLSQQEGLTPVYQLQGNQLIQINNNADGYRLLMEAEWEWLARKAGKPEQTLFVWGNDKTIPTKAVNIADESAKGSVKLYVPRFYDGYAGVAPVKSFDREKSGLYDLGGNVSEWTHDSYSLIVPKLDTVYPHILDTSTIAMRVIKGANWRSGSLSELRASYRDGAEQGRDILGFRIGRFLSGGNE